MTRYGQIINIKPEMIDRYKYLHANPWPKVTEMITKCNIKNYSIFLRDDLLFAFFEYHGNAFEVDMAKMAADKTTQEWWDECMPCQQPIETATKDDWWVTMEEVFYQE